MKFNIRNRAIGDGEPCYVTFEAGPTHSGLSSAIELVKTAAASGADAVKFQIFDPDKLVADRSQLFSYEILIDRETGETRSVSEPLYDILLRRYLKPEDWLKVKAVADELNLAFFATVGFPEDIELLQKMKCDSIKIASADVNHFPLIRLAARTGMCIQLDTGSSTLGEIEKAVDIILKEGNEKIIIHQCPSGYPARVESIHLRMISTLKQMFPFPIAFSDHTPGWDMDIAALVLGAKMIEKTITKDRMTQSVEHIFSLEEKQLVPFVSAIRDVETALGQPRRILSDAELEKRNRIRRSIFAKRDMRKGEKLTETDIEYRRPGTGLQPDKLDLILGKSIVTDVASGHMFTLLDFRE
ncbi:MAG: N-acetylneuraminate synthase family protein [Turneriella sp.]